MQMKQREIKQGFGVRNEGGQRGTVESEVLCVTMAEREINGGEERETVVRTSTVSPSDCVNFHASFPPRASLLERVASGLLNKAK